MQRTLMNARNVEYVPYKPRPVKVDKDFAELSGASSRKDKLRKRRERKGHKV